MNIRRTLVSSLAAVMLASPFVASSQAAGGESPAASQPRPLQDVAPADLVVFNNTQKNFFLNNPQWVHAGDKFMVVSANAFGGDNEDYDPKWVNETARQLLGRFPGTEVLATTSGERNTRTAIRTVDTSRINIVMTVWEPRNPDFPTEAFNRGTAKRSTASRGTSPGRWPAWHTIGV